MSDRLTLYGYPASTYTRMALVAADEKGLDYSFQIVASWDGYDKVPEFVGKHPFSKVPIVEHRDVMITETIAILMYFETAFDGPRLTPPRPGGARQNVGDHLNHNKLCLACMGASPGHESALQSDGWRSS